MRCLALALLFVTALAAQPVRGGFRGGGFGGHSVGVRGPGFVGGQHRGSFGGVGVRGYGWANRGYRTGINARFGWTQNRQLYGTYGYGGVWGYPFGWYSAPMWASPAVYGAPYPSAAPYPHPYNPGPNVTIIVVPPANVTAPQQTYTQPRVDPPPVSRSAPAEQTSPERPLATESWAYVIVAKDGTVWLAREYRSANGMLRFTTTAGEQRWMRLTEVDVTATEQLNRERGVAVRLE